VAKIHLENQQDIDKLIYLRLEEARTNDISVTAQFLITGATLYYWWFLLIDSWTGTLTGYSIFLWYSRSITIDYPPIAILLGLVIIGMNIGALNHHRKAASVYGFIFLLDGLIPILIQSVTYLLDISRAFSDPFWLVVLIIRVLFICMYMYMKIILYNLFLQIPSPTEYVDSSVGRKIRQEVNQAFLDQQRKNVPRIGQQD
jgi:hypothetical protein